IDRMTTAFLEKRIGEVFAGRISAVTRFGLFITLEESGADGLAPISTLPDDYYVHDERQHSLVGRRWGRVYTLGQALTVELMEAQPLTGGLILGIVETEEEEPRRLTTKGSKKKKASPRRSQRS